MVHLSDLGAEMLDFLLCEIEFAFGIFVVFLLTGKGFGAFFAPSVLLLLLWKCLPEIECCRQVLVVFLLYFASRLLV